MSSSTNADLSVPAGLTPELMHWVQSQSSAGVPLPALLQSMRDVGWRENLARRALGLPEEGELPPPFSAETQPHSVKIDSQAAGVPEPDLKTDPCCIRVDGHEIQILMSLQNPRIVVFGNLLTAQECDAIIEAARPRMQRSLTVDNQNGGESLNDDRTSNGMFFQRGENDVVRKLEQRIARLLKWPVENGEGLQVLHYRSGAEYKPHHDYFAPNEPGTPSILKRGGQRVGTLVMYLNEPVRGGGTTFPEVPLQVMPRRGNAVFFSYDRPDPSTRTLHGGAPVLEGEKWIATKWLREREFR